MDRLTDLERNSAAWKKVESYLRDRIESLRASNDADLDPTATARLRGRIAAMKEILALGSDPTPDTPD